MKNVKTKSIHSMDRIFMIVKVLLVVSPFMALSYLTMNTAKYGGNIQTALSNNPNLTVMFLVAMVNPFIAYLLGYLQKHLKEGDYDYAVVNLGLLLVAEVMLQNMLYVLVLAYLLYKCVKTYQIPVKGCIKRLSQKGLFLSISGSVVVLVFAGICLFAMMQIA